MAFKKPEITFTTEITRAISRLFRRFFMIYFKRMHLYFTLIFKNKILLGKKIT
jgi:hypothetical protein